MTTMYDVDANELIEKAAHELKKMPEMKAPEWATFAKTGMHKARPPVNGDWWHVRAASVLRTVYRLGPVGVQKLRTKYGGRKNRGHKKEHTFKGSGNILRKILQQLTKAGFVKFVEKGVHKGRVITPKGKSFLDKISNQINHVKPKAEVKSHEIKPHEAKAEETHAKKEAEKAEDKKEIKHQPKEEKKQ